jgi:hypothetical protein
VSEAPNPAVNPAQAGTHGNVVVPIALTLIANALAAWFALRGGWTVGALMTLFWFENGMVGLAQAARLLALPGPPVLHGMKFVLLPFFALHYGLFFVLHGFFVNAVFVDTFEAPTAAPGFLIALLASAVAIAWQAGHAHLAYVVPAHAPDEIAASHRDATVARRLVLPLMKVGVEPYPRVIALHLALVLGGMLGLWLGTPWAAAVLLLVLKTAIELAQALGFGRRFTDAMR